MATFVASTSAAVTSTPNVSVAKPSGLATGHTVFLAVITRGNVSMTAPPLDPGSVAWPEVDGAGGASGSTASQARIYVYRHYVDNAGAEPANYTATLSTSGNGCVICWAVSGLADDAGAVQVASLAGDVGSDALVDSPGVTAPSDGALAFRLAAMNTSAGIIGWSTTGLTEDEDVAPGANRVSGVLGHHTQDAGVVAAKTWAASLASGTTYGPAVGVTIIVGEAPAVASAGSDQTVAPGTIVTVDCSASAGTILSRSLTQVSGAVDISDHIVDATTATPKFIAPAPPGTSSMALVLRETVVGSGNTDTDDATITVTPAGSGTSSGPTLIPRRLGPDGLPV